MGVAVMPRLVASIAVRDGVVVVPLRAGTVTRTVSIVSRREDLRSAASTTMRTVLREAATRTAAGRWALDLLAADRWLAA